MKKTTLQKSIIRKNAFSNYGMGLEDFCDRKSFYHKAKVVDLPKDAGEKGVECKKGLVSYDTLVATVTEKKDGTAEFKRTWSGYSSTTGRHIAAFSRMFGFDAIGKAELDKLEVHPVPGFKCDCYCW